MSPEPHEAVALCIITFRRPEGLRAALGSVARLEVPPTVDLTVVVVDNDEVGQGAEVARSMADGFPFPLRIAVEAERGIPFARNRCLTEAPPTASIVFLDDDELIRADWIGQALAVRERTRADVVMGPGLPEYPPGTPDWVVAGRFFEMDERPDGSELPWHLARTSGVLIGRRAIDLAGSPAFDRRFALTGGEDLQFFLRAHRAGATFAWAAHAIVDMPLPSSRVTAGWVLKRGYRIGTTRSLVRLSVQSGPWQRTKRILQGSRAILRGLWYAAGAVRNGRARGLEGLRRVGIGSGTIAGAVGLQYREYRTIHGS